MKYNKKNPNDSIDKLSFQKFIDKMIGDIKPVGLPLVNLLIFEARLYLQMQI